MAANKVPGIRCAPVAEPYSAELARRHNDANVIAFSERLTGWEMIERMLDVYLETPFDGGRHAYRDRAALRVRRRAARAHAEGDRTRRGHRRANSQGADRKTVANRKRRVDILSTQPHRDQGSRDLCRDRRRGAPPAREPGADRVGELRQPRRSRSDRLA